MNSEEFKIWLKHHRACYVGLSNWISKLPEPGKERDGEPNRQDTLLAWRTALQNVDFNLAIAASTAMHSGEEQEPKGWDRHPAAIYTIAMRQRSHNNDRYRPRYADNQETFHCLLCQDSGWVSIWHPISMRAARDGTLGDASTVSSCAARCTCKAGDETKKSGAVKFDNQTMLPINGCDYDPKELDKLRTFMARSMEWNRKFHMET